MPFGKLATRADIPFHRVLRKMPGNHKDNTLTWRRPEYRAILIKERVKFDDGGKLLEMNRLWFSFQPPRAEAVSAKLKDRRTEYAWLDTPKPAPIPGVFPESSKTAEARGNTDPGYLARKERFREVQQQALFRIAGHMGLIDDDIVETVASSHSIRQYEMQHPEWSMSGDIAHNAKCGPRAIELKRDTTPPRRQREALKRRASAAPQGEKDPKSEKKAGELDDQ